MRPRPSRSLWPACSARSRRRQGHSVTVVTAGPAWLPTSDPRGTRPGQFSSRGVAGSTREFPQLGQVWRLAGWSLLGRGGPGTSCAGAGSHGAQDRGTGPQSPWPLGSTLPWTEPAPCSPGCVWPIDVADAPCRLWDRSCLAPLRRPNPLCSLQPPVGARARRLRLHPPVPPCPSSPLGSRARN